MDVKEIMRVLPHRYPFLMIDRVLEHVPGEKAVAIKNVTVNEPQFTGHYPDQPVMPGVLMIEAMAQTSGIAVIKEELQGKRPLLGGVDKARFRKPVVPGDQMVITAEVVRLRKSMGRTQAWIEVDGEQRAEAEMLFFISDI